jgi:hypothetical protein
MDVPVIDQTKLPFAFETRNVPCRTNPLGVKGGGRRVPLAPARRS